MVESRNPMKGSEGRDHHPFAFSLWMAGGGIKSGQIVGKTDEFGLNIVEDRIHIHDPACHYPSLSRAESRATNPSPSGA
jgi:hypothetical protein